MDHTKLINFLIPTRSSHDCTVFTLWGSKLVPLASNKLRSNEIAFEAETLVVLKPWNNGNSLLLYCFRSRVNQYPQDFVSEKHFFQQLDIWRIGCCPKGNAVVGPFASSAKYTLVENGSDFDWWQNRDKNTHKLCPHNTDWISHKLVATMRSAHLTCPTLIVHLLPHHWQFHHSHVIKITMIVISICCHRGADLKASSAAPPIAQRLNYGRISRNLSKHQVIPPSTTSRLSISLLLGLGTS